MVSIGNRSPRRRMTEPRMDTKEHKLSCKEDVCRMEWVFGPHRLRLDSIDGDRRLTPSYILFESIGVHSWFYFSRRSLCLCGDNSFGCGRRLR